MSAPSPQPGKARQFRWLLLGFAAALLACTFVSWHAAGKAPVQPVSGGTFLGYDVAGHLVRVHLFELDHTYLGHGWQGWLYREGQGRADFFFPPQRHSPWRAKAEARELDDGREPPESFIAATADPRELQATLPRLGAWGNDTTALHREFEHWQFRRRAGLRLGRLGGTQEYLAQFPHLPATNAFHAALNREIIAQCETAAAEFTSEPFSFWKDMVQMRDLPGFNEYTLSANWQLRWLTTNLASFYVWSYDETGGNGNHSHFHGANFLATADGLRELTLAELFRPEVDWRSELRTRCVPKLKADGAPTSAMEQVIQPDTAVDTFTLSPTGLQLIFNPYAIASGAEGEFVVHFDYAELKELLRPTGPAALLPRRE